MRHMFLAGAMVLAALVVTFGTASLLQIVAVAQARKPVETVVVEAAKPALKPVGGKERSAPQMRDGVVRVSATVTGL